MKKKLLMALLALTMAFVVCFGLVACGEGGNYSDTFAGAISEESYSSSEDAVKGFLATEISGEVVKAELVDTESKGMLSEEEVAALAVGDVIAEGDVIESAEVMVVTYRNTAGARSYAARPEGEDVFEFTIYILKVTPNGSELYEFRYYVPKANNGDVLTRSYYEDVLNPAKYINCTQTYTYSSTSSVAGQKVKINQNFTMKVENDKASINMHWLDPEKSTYDVAYTDILGYFEESDGDLIVWLSRDGAPYVMGNNNAFEFYDVTDIASFATMNIPKIDYSYYEKTSYGFKIQDDFISKYLERSMGSIGMDATAKVELRFYVSEGRLVKMIADITVKTNVSGYTMTTTAKEELAFSDFGTTTVTKPAGIN